VGSWRPGYLIWLQHRCELVIHKMRKYYRQIWIWNFRGCVCEEYGLLRCSVVQFWTTYRLILHGRGMRQKKKPLNVHGELNSFDKTSNCKTEDHTAILCFADLIWTDSVVQQSEFVATDPEVRVWFPALPDFWEVVGLERGPLNLVSTIEELLERKSRGSELETREYCRMVSAALTTRHPSVRKS
jgi:hypothetical protein